MIFTTNVTVRWDDQELVHLADAFAAYLATKTEGDEPRFVGYSSGEENEFLFVGEGEWSREF